MKYYHHNSFLGREEEKEEETINIVRTLRIAQTVGMLYFLLLAQNRATTTQGLLWIVGAIQSIAPYFNTPLLPQGKKRQVYGLNSRWEKRNVDWSQHGVLEAKLHLPICLIVTWPMLPTSESVLLEAVRALWAWGLEITRCFRQHGSSVLSQGWRWSQLSNYSK